MSHTVKIAPSLLSANFAELGQELKRLTASGADWIHLDVMDGHFVPNMTIGPQIVKQLRSYTDLPFDVHLMIEPVDPFIRAFAEAGANHITIHPESGPHLHRSLQTIRSLGKKAGVALNPGTSPDVLKYLLDDVDLILVMTVNPGFGGQDFIESQLQKIKDIHAMVRGKDIEIAVDGGVTIETAPKICEAGASVLIAGTAVFANNDYASSIQALRSS